VSETAPGANPYKIYWITWGILLVITLAMLAAEAFHMPRIVLVVFLLAFMTVKAAMIGGNFMHLRFERRNLALMVSSGILVTSLILYFFITPESWHVKKATDFPGVAPAGETAPAKAPAH
jgi:cytochrome c oxidase subunit IV